MYCPNCGNKIPDDSNFCDKCGTKLEKKNRKYNYSIFWGTGIVLVSVLLIVIIFALIIHNSSKTDKLVEESAKQVADAFNSSDMKSINEAVFGIKTDVLDKDVAEMLNIQDEQADDGLLSEVFRHVSISVSAITEDTVEYKIEAPDLSNVFVDIESKSSLSIDSTEQDVLDYFVDYMEHAEMKTESVQLKYEVVDNSITIDYLDEKFINAITGGLLDAYSDFYQNVILEIRESEE